MDRYQSFSELATNERGQYRITIRDRASATVILAPHGGGIEPGTTELAEAIAGSELSYYGFESLKRDGNRDLHLTSYRFDEPGCLRLVASARTVISIHGCEGEEGRIHVGGLDARLRDTLIDSLVRAGFDALSDNSHHAGVAPTNICNRGATGRGVQLEIDTAQRRRLFAGLRRAERRQTTAEFDRLVLAIRAPLIVQATSTAEL